MFAQALKQPPGAIAPNLARSLSVREQLKTDGEESEPPAKRPHLEMDVASAGAVCNGEPLEDYTKMDDSQPAATRPVKVKVSRTAVSLQCSVHGTSPSTVYRYSYNNG